MEQRTAPSIGRLSFLALLAFLLALGTAGCTGKKGPSQKERARANWNAARAGVLLNLANDQYRNGNFADSRKTLNDALKLSQELPGIFLLKGKLDIEDGELLDAAQALAAAKVLAPADPEPFYLTGIVQERWQRSEMALIEYQGAMQRSPTELAYALAVAETLVGLDRTTEAAELLEARVTFFESAAPLRDMLGQVYMDLQRFHDAAEMFRQAAMLAPDEPALRERHALALVQAGDHRRAGELLERLINEREHSQNISLHMALGECRMQQEAYAAARAAFQRAARIEERNVAAWLGVGKAALALGDLSRVEMALSRAEAIRTTGQLAGDVAVLRGYLLLKQDRPQEAAAKFASAGRLVPTDPTPVVMYGYCQQLMGKPAEARRFYNRALEMEPGEPLALELLQSLASVNDLWP